jgi:hypothetical protein
LSTRAVWRLIKHFDGNHGRFYKKAMKDTGHIPQPEGRRLYEAAMLELDFAMLLERIAFAVPSLAASKMVIQGG